MEMVYWDWTKTNEREREQESIAGEVQADLKLWKFVCGKLHIFVRK